MIRFNTKQIQIKKSHNQHVPEMELKDKLNFDAVKYNYHAY